MKKNAFKHLDLNWIKLITGPMFSGKTTELLKSLQRYSFADINSVLFSPQIDTRNQNYVSSRDGYKSNTLKIKDSKEILAYIHEHPNIDIIGIDEVQFLEADCYKTLQEIAQLQKIVICCGLDTNWQQEAFPTTKNIMAIADDVVKLSAICKKCGGPATKTFKKSKSKNIVSIGDVDEYEARCNNCMNEKNGH